LLKGKKPAHFSIEEKAGFFNLPPHQNALFLGFKIGSSTYVFVCLHYLCFAAVPSSLILDKKRVSSMNHTPCKPWQGKYFAFPR